MLMVLILVVIIAQPIATASPEEELQRNSTGEMATQVPSGKIAVEDIIIPTFGFFMTVFLAILTYIVVLTQKIAAMEKQFEYLLPFQTIMQEYGIASLRRLLDGITHNGNDKGKN
jgi:hypothetical protein